MSTNDGGPAFPATIGRDDGPHQVGNDTFMAAGMSLRDYFAAQAITGLLSVEGLKPEHLAPAARHAYALADAMLAERAKAAR